MIKRISQNARQERGITIVRNYLQSQRMTIDGQVESYTEPYYNW